MFDRIVKKYVKNSENVHDVKVRESYGKLSGILGIILNTFMCLCKIVVGFLMGSISIISDGINNLSDAGSSVITIFGFKLSSKKPDKEHPFGHGRMEYFAGLAVSIIIIIIAIQLFKDSIIKVINLETLQVDKGTFFYVTIGLLSLSILIKTWMALFNYTLGKKINSLAMKATALDSVTDCISTFVVLVCTVLSLFIDSFSIDGVAGIIVSLFIAFTGVRSVLEVVNPLLGEAPDKELVDSIADFVMNFSPSIVGVHDLMLHDYGPGRKIIVLHAEVPAEGDVLELHDIIDNIEKGLENEFNCIATIHMDPVMTKSERVNELKKVCQDIVKSIDASFDIHDFRMNEGETHANLIFDVVVGHDSVLSLKEVEKLVANKVHEYDNKLAAVVTAEHPLV